MVSEPVILATHLQVVTPAPLPRRGEVVTNRLRPLDDVDRVVSNLVAAQQDGHRRSKQGGVIRKGPALPSDGGLVLLMEAGGAYSNFVHRPIAQHVRERAEVLWSHLCARAAE